MDKMEQILSMTVNSLPAKTWNWLHMNETSLAWKEVSVPCQMISADEQSPFPDTLFEEALKPLFEEKQTATSSFLSTENKNRHISPGYPCRQSRERQISVPEGALASYFET